MCGVAGAVGLITPAITTAVHRMSEAQRHRGPDDSGWWASSEAATYAGACFAFRRLAIIDLSAGHQPMIDAEAGHVIQFNGEIYNFQELRAELEQMGVRFQSRSDTEVVLKGYRLWGLDVLRRLRGMFAFALWDAVQKRVVIARDRLGIKPLYVCNIEQPGDRSTLLFASELRSLLKSGLVEPRLNVNGLRSFIWNGFVIGPETIIEGVRLLPAGCVAIIDPATGRCELERWWSLPEATAQRDAVDQLRNELRTAMRQHLLSDVPLGVFLSGGIDSSAVAALAVENCGAGGGEAVQTFNISFDEAQFDESKHARAVANALGTQHHDIRLTQKHFRGNLGTALDSIDQPTFDAINTYFVSRAVREAGITVALAGTGGDELFGGYRSFVDIPKAARWARLCSSLPVSVLRGLASIVLRFKHGSTDFAPQTRWGKLGDVLASRGRLLELYQSSYGLFTTDFQRELLSGSHDDELVIGLPRGRAHELRRLAGDSPSLHGIATLELANFIGERLLRDTDAASMAVSLEARVPLLDHRVVEAAAAVDPATRFHPLGRKMLLRRLAMPKLDPAMFDRPKAGFVLPIDTWCRDELKIQVDEMFNDRTLCESIGINQSAAMRLWNAYQSNSPGLYWSRIWAVFVLLQWCRQHGVSR